MKSTKIKQQTSLGNQEEEWPWQKEIIYVSLSLSSTDPPLIYPLPPVIIQSPQASPIEHSWWEFLSSDEEENKRKRDRRKANKNTSNTHIYTITKHIKCILGSNTSHFWNRNMIRSILPGLRRRRTGLLLSGPKSSFQINAFHLEIKVWRKSGEAQNPCSLKSSVRFLKSVMIWGVVTSAGVGQLCLIKSKVNSAIYQEILEHFMLPPADKLYGDADFLFQQDLAPAHSDKTTSKWFADHDITEFDWPGNMPDLNHHI